MVGVDLDDVAVAQRRLVAHRNLPDHDRMVGLQNFEPSDQLLEVAEDAEQDIAARSRREKDVILVEQGRVVGDEVGRLRLLQMKAPTVGVRVTAQIAERKFGVVVEKDSAFEVRLDLRPGFESPAIERGGHVFQCDNKDLEAEADFERTVARAAFLQLDFVVFGDRDEDVGQRDVFLRVEIKDEVLVGEHLFVDDDALSGIDAGKFLGAQRPPLH